MKQTPPNHTRVFITGRSLIAAGVNSINDVWDALLTDECLAAPSPSNESLQNKAALEGSDSFILARHQLLALAVTEQAWREAGLSDLRNRLRGEGSKHRNPRIGCVSGSSAGGLAAMESEKRHGGSYKVSPYAMSRWRGNSLAAAVTLRFGLGACDFSINAASGTGAQLAFLAGSLIRWGLADAIVAVAADPELTPSLLEAMMSTRSVAKGKDSRPLNAQRGGMKPSEGAACVIFESEEHVTARGGKPIAEWLCGATANESHHFLAPDEEAAVLEELLRTCLGNDHLAGKKADWISLHATGTPRFDAVEIACIKRVFASGLPWLSAMKRTTGHALGASGLIEAAMLAEGLHKEALPSWPMNTDPALELDSLKPQPPPLPQLALQIGQGMGGVVVVNAYGAIKN